MTAPEASYKAYSTVFQSPIPISGFTQTEDEPQVRVTFGPVASELNNPTVVGPLWVANRSEMLLTAPNLGRYLVTDGNSIIIDAPDQSARLLTVLAGIPVATILMQRDFLVLHAAAFDHPTLGAIAICGENGAGKSSLVTALASSGSARICDNLGAVTTDRDGHHQLHRGPGSFRLWAHSARDFNFDPAKAHRVSEDVDKYMFTDDAALSEAPPVLLNAIICLQTTDVSPGGVTRPAMSRMDDVSATAFVAENHFRNELASTIVPQWFTRVSELATSVPVYRLQRPETGCPPNELGEFLTRELALAIHK